MRDNRLQQLKLTGVFKAGETDTLAQAIVRTFNLRLIARKLTFFLGFPKSLIHRLARETITEPEPRVATGWPLLDFIYRSRAALGWISLRIIGCSPRQFPGSITGRHIQPPGQARPDGDLGNLGFPLQK